MPFAVMNTIALERFARKHRDARTVLSDWLAVVQRATWQNLADLRRTFPSADGVNIRIAGGETVVVTIFNIKGNRYRLITVIQYATEICRIVEVLTHEQYSTDRWKERL